MRVVTIYRYFRQDGGIDASPIEPPAGTEYTVKYRLIADEGKRLTLDGENLTTCVDAVSADGWYEVDAPEYDEISDEEALRLITEGIA